MLVSRHRQLDSNDFQSQLEAPQYEPQDRLLLRASGELVGHIHVAPATIRCHGNWYPVAVLQDAVLPNELDQGTRQAMWRCAEQLARQQGAWALVTSQPDCVSDDWHAMRGLHTLSSSPLDLIGEAQAQSTQTTSTSTSLLETDFQPRYEVRLWRRIELDALCELYDEFAQHHTGSAVRTNQHWNWLVDRLRHERIYVVMRDGAIVGYAVVAECRILEFVVSNEHQEAKLPLLDHLCRDAFEQDEVTLRIDGNIDNWLRSIFLGASHSTSALATNTPWRMRLVVPWTRVLAPNQNGKKEELRSIGLLVGRQQSRLTFGTYLTEFGPQVYADNLENGKLGRSYLKLSPSTLEALLLGNESLQSAITEGRVIASTAAAQATAEVLFATPTLNLPWWDLHRPNA